MDKEIYEKQLHLMQQCPNLVCSKFDNTIYTHVAKGGNLKAHPDYEFDRTKDPTKEAIGLHQRMSRLLTAEFCYSEMSLRRLDDTGVSLSLVFNKELSSNLYRYQISQLYDNSYLMLNDKVVVASETKGTLNIGTIKQIDRDSIWFSLPSPCLGPDDKYSVRFAAARDRMWNHKCALRMPLWLKQALINVRQSVDISLPVQLKISAEDTASTGNRDERQRQAIKNILEARCRPRPYILLGPPGTGKTSTLIELIAQIHKRARHFRILVSTSSNSCADKLASDIDKDGRVNSMARLTSFRNRDLYGSRQEQVPEYYVNLAEVSKYKVIVTTNMMTGLLRLVIKFDYVIVDEAGHASEPETLMALNLCKQDGCSVLAGDPKQLGPVIKCPQANRLGLGISLLTRLRETVQCYKQKHRQDSSSFDERYITKLLVCYRSDPRVMQVCNEMFYNNELVCKGETPPDLLRSLGVKHPSLFIDAHGEEQRDRRFGSRCNPFEADVCVDQIFKLYNSGLKMQQIGLITPYKWQKHQISIRLIERLKSEYGQVFGGNSVKLSKKAKKKLASAGKSKSSSSCIIDPNWLCKIDTVDGFQGDERDVMLISLVRTVGPLSFINDKCRFNVSLSRARWLNIVIGNQKVLTSSQRWSRYIRLSHKSEASLIQGRIVYK